MAKRPPRPSAAPATPTPHGRGPGRRRARAVPVRVRPSLQGLPRPGGRARRQQLVPRPFEGLPGEVDWVMMREIVPAATARVTLAGSAAGPYVGREAVVATVLPLAWPALARVDGEVFVGPAGARGLRRREPRPRRRARCARWRSSPGRRCRRVRCRTPGRACRTCSTPTGALRGGAARRLRLLDRGRERRRRRHPSVDGAGQRPRHPDGTADLGRGRVLGADARPLPPALGAARAGGGAARRRWPGCTASAACRSARAPATSVPSGRTACSSRSGTCRTTPSRMPSRGRRPASGPGSTRRSRSRAPLTDAERRARNGLLSRQLTLR